MNVIETRALTKDYGRGRGLFGLDLAVPERRVHGFLGPNGSGKTTAIRLLMGFLRPTRGASRVLGLDPVTQAHRIMVDVGYVPGELALPALLTARDYLDQSARLRPAVDLAWRRELAGRLGVDMRTRLGTLSKGNRQKVALLDALQHRPALLVLDEPTDGLDPLLRVEVRDILRSHVRDGGTVFLSSHIVHEVQTVCDDVSIVLSGRLRTQARIRDLVAKEGVLAEAQVPDMQAACAAVARAGAVDLLLKGDRLRFRVRGDPMPAFSAVAAAGGTLVELRQGDLEEAFLRLYGGEGAEA